MKKILFTFGIFLLANFSFAQTLDYSDGWSYCITNTAGAATTTVPTNRVLWSSIEGTGHTSSNRSWLISEIQVKFPANNAVETVKFFDHWGGADYDPAYGVVVATNAFTNAWRPLIVSQYRTNYVNTYISSTGITNYYTNLGLYSLISTGLTATGYGYTNVLTPFFQITKPVSTTADLYAFTNLNIRTAKGVLLQHNTNIAVYIRYKELFSPTYP